MYDTCAATDFSARLWSFALHATIVASCCVGDVMLCIVRS